jgi:hypothetical protein
MTSHLESVTMSHDTSWTWNVVPLLAAAAVLSALFLSPGNAATDTAATEAAGLEAPSMTQLLVPSPQPGMGEPAIVVADLPQSY